MGFWVSAYQYKISMDLGRSVMKALKGISLILAIILTASAAGEVKIDGSTYDVRRFGAVGDGKTLNTQAIQKAIEKCSEEGGGVVILQRGVYKAGTIYLKSNVTLHIEAGAVLLQSKDMNDYVEAEDTSYVRHTSSRYAFLYGNRVKNVSITGKGKIDGNMAMDFFKGRAKRGPLPIILENSENILLQDITVINSPSWSITFSGCKGVDVIRVKCLNSRADGINPVCCQDVLFDGVLIDGSGDDPIAIKNDSTGYSYETRPDCGYLTENVVITNTTISNTTHPPIKFGTGTYGIFKNIVVSNCTFENTGSMFTIQLMRPKYEGTEGRTIENVVFSNIAMKNVRSLFDITSMDVSRTVIRNLLFDNIIADGVRWPSIIYGLPDGPIEDLTISNIKLTRRGGAAAFWLKSRYVNGLKLRDIELDLGGKVENAVVFEHGGDLELDNVSIKGITGKGPVVRLNQVKGAFIHNCRVPAVETFVYAEGSQTEGVSFVGNDLRGAKKPFDAAQEVRKGAMHPAAERIEFSNLDVSKEIKSNERFEVNVNLKNAGDEGAFKADVCVDGKVSGSKWLWLGSGESRQAGLASAKYYKPRSHKMKVGPLSAIVKVKARPADFEFGEIMKVQSPAGAGELTSVTVGVKNIGGKKGSKEVKLYADGKVVASRKVTLVPGEEKDVTIEHRFEEGGLRKLKVGDFPVWPYATFANTKADYYQTRDRIIIDAGGGRSKLWTREGEYAAVYLKDVKGDFVATVKLLSQVPTGPYASVGLIVRNDITKAKDSAGYLLLNVEPKYGGQQTWRADLDGDGMLDSHSYGSWSGYPMWFKIEKKGKTFTAYTGPDGIKWYKNKRVFEVGSAESAQDVAIFANAYSAKNETSRVELQYFNVERLTENSSDK